MCELFAMSSLRPATVNLSLEEFARHGGQGDANKDGWGIAFYEYGDARIVKEPVPAIDSDAVQFINKHRYRSRTVVSHIRHATQGEVSYSNTHPFHRELGGHSHVFAHNGQFDSLSTAAHLGASRFRPIGQTDSEIAFCTLLQKLENLWLAEAKIPPLKQRLEIVVAFAATLRKIGPANFLYADGDALFVHSDRRRTSAEFPPEPPGLYCLSHSGSGAHPAGRSSGMKINSPGPDSQAQEVMLIASVPLTEEKWSPIPEGEVLALKSGRIVERVAAS
jgi:predicted glutamine amidotransferase